MKNFWASKKKHIWIQWDLAQLVKVEGSYNSEDYILLYYSCDSCNACIMVNRSSDILVDLM